MTQDVQTILSQRGPVYGDFNDNAICAQMLKTVMRKGTSWEAMPPVMREALDLIALKLSRILTGNDPFYLDSWDDLAGYATLVANHIRSGSKRDAA